MNKKEDLHTAVTCGTIDRELFKITPIFLAKVEVNSVRSNHQVILSQDVWEIRGVLVHNYRVLSEKSA